MFRQKLEIPATGEGSRSPEQIGPPVIGMQPLVRAGMEANWIGPDQISLVVPEL